MPAARSMKRLPSASSRMPPEALTANTGSVVPTPSGRASRRRAISSCDFGPGTSVTSRRSCGSCSWDSGVDMTEPPDDLPKSTGEPIFFGSPEEWRDWLREHSQTVTECLVGFVKVGTGRAGLTWPAAVDEALCVGWIDAVRRRIDDEHYSIRFTRRKPTSNWSRINVERFTALEAEGRVTDAGRAAFARRQDDRTAIYAYEMEAAQLEEDEARQLR